MTKITEVQLQKIFKARDVFVKHVQGWKLFKYQIPCSDKIIRAVFTNSGETIAGEWTRQSGKTTTIVVTVGFLLLFYFPLCKRLNITTTPQFNVGFFAPQMQQAQSSFNMLRDLLKRAKQNKYDLQFDTFNGDTINIKTEKYPPCSVYCMTASPTSKQESKTLNLILFDESQDLVDKVIDKAITPMGASTNAPEVFIGVGGYKKCRFLHHIERLPEDCKFIIPYDEVLKEREQLYDKTGNDIYLNYHRHIEKRLREIGEDSDEFKTQYRLLWILERGQFVSYEKLMSLEKEYELYDEYGKWDVLYAGIDWGKAHDSTILTIINQRCQVIAWYEWSGDDYANQVEEIKYLVERKYRGLKTIRCDSTGNQDMGVDILRRYLEPINVEVIGVPFTSKSKDEMYKNLSRLMTDKIISGQVIQEAVFQFPKFPLQKKNENGSWEKERSSVCKEKFIKQMCDLQKEIKNELWRCNHPDGPTYHDDYCDSVALACMQFLPRLEEVSSYEPIVC